MILTSGLYYKHVTIVNYASSGVKKLKASLNDDTRVVIYNRHMFIAQATGHSRTHLVSRKGNLILFCTISSGLGALIHLSHSCLVYALETETPTKNLLVF